MRHAETEQAIIVIQLIRVDVAGVLLDRRALIVVNGNVKKSLHCFHLIPMLPKCHWYLVSGYRRQ